MTPIKKPRQGPSLGGPLQVCTESSYHQHMTIRVPINAAAKRGVSSLAALANDERVVLTVHGRPVAVVDTAERLDEDLRRLREAARAVVDAAADRALGHRPATLALDDVCARLGIDPAAVRARAEEHRVAS